MTGYANPFATWSRLLTELHCKLSGHKLELSNEIAHVITHCEHLAHELDELERTDRNAWEAFQRALADTP
jgi:hypothetical protein